VVIVQSQRRREIPSVMLGVGKFVSACSRASGGSPLGKHQHMIGCFESAAK
jgi:hypothetical protein